MIFPCSDRALLHSETERAPPQCTSPPVKRSVRYCRAAAHPSSHHRGFCLFYDTQGVWQTLSHTTENRSKHAESAKLAKSQIIVFSTKSFSLSNNSSYNNFRVCQGWQTKMLPAAIAHSDYGNRQLRPLSSCLTDTTVFCAPHICPSGWFSAPLQCVRGASSAPRSRAARTGAPPRRTPPTP